MSEKSLSLIRWFSKISDFFINGPLKVISLEEILKNKDYAIKTAYSGETYHPFRANLPCHRSEATLEVLFLL